jgi:DNA-damage-inducible protein J
MANGLLQIRIDENLKRDASELYSQLGIDLPTAVRMFLLRSVQVQGIPFSMQLPAEVKATSAVEAMKRISEDARRRGIADMSLDEINDEIKAVRNSKA